MTDCRTYRGADIFSDHELLISTITMKLAKPKSRGAKGKFATYKLNDRIMKERYQQEVKKHLIEENSQQLEIEEDWDNIKNGILHAAENTIGRIRHKRKEWISVQTEELVEKRRTAKARKDSTGTRRSSEEYRKLDALVKKKVQRKTNRIGLTNVLVS